MIIQNSVGEKIGHLVFSFSAIIAGIVISFCVGPLFALVALAYFPGMAMILGFFSKYVKKAFHRKTSSLKKLGGIVEETLSAVKLIVSFAQEEREVAKFYKQATETKDIAHQTDILISFLIGMVRFLLLGFYSYAFWIGTVYVRKNYYNEVKGTNFNSGTILTVIITNAIGLINLLSLNPNIRAINEAKVVGKTIFDVVDRVPLIADHNNCVDDFTVTKAITFTNVTFKYPTAANQINNVLQGVNFHIKAGETTAIVGPSGSGKSTIIQMIERFYEPLEGQIFFDNLNLKDIKLKALRENIGYVSQEPVLILGTVRDNLLFGNKDASEADIKEALQKANATFVYETENGLDTYIGSSAVLNLSGGQKQRIAIARALIKKPKILILDEATSALDPRSEKEVQGAIDSIASGDNKLTIITIAHRLQTIASSRNLLFIENKKSIVPAVKGTPEYDVIWKKLQEEHYAHQKEDGKKSKKHEEATKTQEITV